MHVDGCEDFFSVCLFVCHVRLLRTSSKHTNYVVVVVDTRTTVVRRVIAVSWEKVNTVSLNGNKNVFQKCDTRRCSLQNGCRATKWVRNMHASGSRTGNCKKPRLQTTARSEHQSKKLLQELRVHPSSKLFVYYSLNVYSVHNGRKKIR